MAEALNYVSAGGLIVDVGGGSSPTIPRAQRPPVCSYIGVDPYREGLDAGDYDERVVASAEDPLPQLAGCVDLIVTYDTLEHVANVPLAIARFHELLRPGGTLLAHFSGRWGLFAVAARAMPHRLRTWLLASLLGVDEADHFPTHYDHCTKREFDEMLKDWRSHEVQPFYYAAGYLAFSRPLLRMYLRYEEQVAMRNPQLATHYHVRAVK